MFFLPTLVSTNELVGFWSYAIAHGAQYLIFMVVLSGNRKRGTVGLSVFALVFAAMLVAFEHLNRSGAGLAAYTGIVMSHFLIDAKIWRLREPLQRNLIHQRFAFLFP
jgi:drug/metabolite transporter superfamily protein YnfA